ncbi:DNA-directed RNA polymerase subunit beta' [Labeo rohita]|uniref:DNA-directed RNA polymerase subunit beta n=1 Tax=Labeo rohita TaxID=84645 RepID=A0ABQ8MEC6_LABRO|nr:DNA-directed RNA polymerase subunit beta' [Labeo rohita]
MKVHGIPEAVKENVHEEVIHVCQEVLPQKRDQLPAAIDVAHQLGSKRLNESRPRAVIVHFAVEVWKAAKKQPVPARSRLACHRRFNEGGQRFKAETMP